MRLRLRHLMILVVYVAVALALLLAALRTTGPERPKEVFNTVLYMPTMLAMLSALILRPGASRDLITALLVTSQFVFLALPPTALGLLTIILKGSLPGPPGASWLGVAQLAIALPYCLMFWMGVVALTRWHLIPLRCPHCGRKTLIEPVYRMANDRSVKGLYLRCGVCDSECFLNRSQWDQGCPSCGRHTLIPKRYSFYWCLSCQARYKRLRHGVWEEATITQDDGFFWLWSLGGWSRSLLARIATIAHRSR
jgi:rRNA maturation protein Nop10